MKKTQMPKFIKNELKSDSKSESDLDLDDKEWQIFKNLILILL